MISKTVKRSSKKTTMATNGGAERVEVVGLGEDVRAQTQEGGTALHFAAQYGYGEAVKALVALGADVHAQTQEGATALHSAML